ncbi:MAG TPA: response regulator [Polyangia bacterium]|jgi:DNA-binding response OmpR family regulator
MTPSPRKTVLILDDSPLVLDMASAALEDAGFAVLAAHTLQELEEMRVSGNPDLILLDVQMPEAFGDDVGAVLRAVRDVTVPIVLFSNVGDRELLQRVREAGIDGFISKRAGLGELVTRVRALLAPDPEVHT